MEKVDKIIDERITYFEHIFRDIETETLLSIVDLMQEGALSVTGEYNLQQLTKTITLDKHTLDTLSKLLGKPLDEVLRVLKDIGIESIDFETYRKAYDLGILKDIDSLDITPMIRELQREVDDSIKSVHLKAKEHAFKQFKRIADKARLEVAMGLKTPNQAMIDSVKALNKEGIHSATYQRQGQDVHYSLEPVMTRMIRSEMIKTSNTVSHNVGVELGVEHWYITQHLGARNEGVGHQDHESWQGTVVTTDELSTVAGYGEVDGLGGVNCRHRHYAHIKGVSPKPPKKISSEDNDRQYKLEQKQKRYEREVRLSKREILMLERLTQNDEVILAVQRSRRLLKAREKRLDDFVKANETLKRNQANERVAGFGN